MLRLQPGGRPYIGNAKWLGASLATLLRSAGIRSGASQLLCTSADGFTSGTPVQVVMDGRDALLAVAMNGSPLPVAHGFPARMVVPGLYGYVSATKWVTDINVTTFADAQGYWVPRGWSQQAPIKTESRIDVPNGSAPVRAGRAQVAGVAWAQHKGIDAVEVRVDGGPWHQARLAAVPGIDTWRQWVWDWDAAPGNHRSRPAPPTPPATPRPGSRRRPSPTALPDTRWSRYRCSSPRAGRRIRAAGRGSGRTGTRPASGRSRPGSACAAARAPAPARAARRPGSAR